MQERLISKPRVQRALLALILGSGISIAILYGRAAIYGEFRFSFFPWNLLLAWIPMIFALIFYSQRARGSTRIFPLGICAVIWFFFYPNAPYLITDLVHLKTREPVPRWYDLLMMMSFAWTGLFLGYFSLYLMQECVRAWRGRITAWIFTIGMLFLGALGVYVGRFWRWNSWEVLTKPWGLAGDAARRLIKMPNQELALFMGTFFAFSLLIYLSLYALTHLHGYVDLKDQPEKAMPPQP